MIFVSALPLVFWLTSKPVIPPGYFQDPPGLTIPKDCELFSQLPNLFAVVKQEEDKNVQCDGLPESGLKAN